MNAVLSGFLSAADTPYLRYVLELTMIVPASVLCLLPLRRYYAGPRWLVILIAALEEMLVILVGAQIAVLNRYPSILILAVSVVLFFPSLMLAVQISLPKMIFCFVHALMLCFYANLITYIITLPWEQDQLLTYSPLSSLICLVISLVLGICFYRSMVVKLPDLFSERQLDRLWFLGILLCVLSSVLMLWHLQSDEYILADGFRTRLIVTLVMYALLLLMIYQLLWWFARRLREDANLTQENNLLRMESKRFASLYRYLDESRTLRHDFRQHVRVLKALAGAGKTEELAEYLATLDDSSAVLVRYCQNPTVDALASHYTAEAETQNARIDWTLELPEALNMRASDFCSILGNLVENAIQAVAKLPEEQRYIQVVARMLSDQMIGISVENPYLGRVRLRSDGLPAVRRRSHGIGLHSVAATVKKYDGTMDLDVADGFFRVHILMYPHPSPPIYPATPEPAQQADMPSAEPDLTRFGIDEQTGDAADTRKQKGPDAPGSDASDSEEKSFSMES